LTIIHFKLEVLKVNLIKVSKVIVINLKKILYKTEKREIAVYI